MIITTESRHGPPAVRLVLAVCALAASVLALLLLAACGTQPTKVSTAANAATPSPACQLWQSNGGTGELSEMQQGMAAIQADLNAGNTQSLQVDGMAMSQITTMDVVTNAPPVLPGAWARMVLDLNKTGQALVGGDVVTASGNLALAKSYASDLTLALHQRCGF